MARRKRQLGLPKLCISLVHLTHRLISPTAISRWSHVISLPRSAKVSGYYFLWEQWSSFIFPFLKQKEAKMLNNLAKG